MALDRDAYFTPLKDSEQIIKDLLTDYPELRSYDFVEPSAGSGSFLYAAEEENIKIQGYDIHPMHDDIILNDFLLNDLDLSGKVVIGNPPYGVRSRLALQFIDRAFSLGAEYVGFLLTGNFSTYSTISRIQANCELISIRRYNVKFENELGEVIKGGCFADQVPSCFLLFKKSDKKIKELALSKTYERTLDNDNSDFCVGYKFYRNVESLPEVGEQSSKGDGYYLKNIKHKKIVFFYKCADINETFVRYFSHYKINGNPTENTLNFYSTYPNIVKDLVP